MCLSLEPPETPAPLAGLSDPPWGSVSGFVEAEVGGSRREGLRQPAQQPPPTLCRHWGSQVRVRQWGLRRGWGAQLLRQPGWKSPLDTQKQERHIKPIINILPGKNTKSIFFSEKLISWKAERLGLMSGEWWEGKASVSPQWGPGSVCAALPPAYPPPTPRPRG